MILLSRIPSKPESLFFLRLLHKRGKVRIEPAVRRFLRINTVKEAARDFPHRKTFPDAARTAFRMSGRMVRTFPVGTGTEGCPFRIPFSVILAHIPHLLFFLLLRSMI